MKKDRARQEIKVCGINAALALARRRTDDIARVFLVEDRIGDMAPILKACAERKRPYRIVAEEELSKIADTVHHEGVCIVARPKPVRTLEAFLSAARRARGPFAAVALERVRNPHNLGAIFRVAAHFGASAILVLGETVDSRVRPAHRRGTPRVSSALSTAVHRTAEGGVESVDLVEVTGDPHVAFGALKRAGFRIVGTSSRAERSLFDVTLPDRVLFLLGSEATGLSERILGQCDDVLSIPGTGAVESLNIAASSAVFLAEVWRTRASLRVGGRSRGRQGSPRLGREA